MMHGFVGDSSLGMSGIVSAETVATTAAREITEESFALTQLVESQVKETGALAIDNRDAQTGLSPKEGSERFQMEAVVHKQLSGGKHRGQIKFTPNLLSAASENGLGPGLVAMKMSRDVEDAIQVGTGGAVLAMLFGIAKRIADEVLGQDSFLTVRSVLGRLRLKIKAQRAVVGWRMKLR
jgi:hypothetical protein